jgi:Carbohydrate binding domain.
MGLMDDPTSGAQLVLTPHPVTLDGQRHMAAELAPGETLGPYLRRVVPGWADDAWEVRVNGVLVPVEVLDRVRPKSGSVIEVRGIVKRQVLAIVAFAALSYFTMGAGLATYGAAVGVTSTAGLSVLGAVTFAAGATLINKVLGPKLPGAGGGQQNDPVYSIGAARNAARPYEPLPLLFGTVRITPDVASAPYTWYEGNDQYLGMVLTPGLNVHSIEALYNGDTPLSSYEGVSTYLNGFPGHADQDIPLFPNADTLAGGELEPGGAWVERTSSPDTVQLQLDFEGMLYDIDGKGRPSWNKVTIAIQYREVGAGSWTSGPSLTISNNNLNVIRRTVSINVPRGQYEVRAQCGTPTWNDGSPYDECRFTWTVLKSIQYDDTDYTGIPRIGIKIKATGQLNGPLDEVRCVAHSRPVPVWNGSAWVTEHTSNPGAHLLAYARGIYDSNGRLLAGIGLADSQIDIPALQAFMVHCEANGYTYDAYIKDARTHQEMVNAIALAGFGQVSWAGGKFSVVWAADGQPITSVVNMANIKRASFRVDYTLANGADGIEATYVDATDWETKTLRVEAPGVTTMQNPARITLEGVTDEEHAAKLARYHLAQHLYQYKDISFAQDLEHLSYQRMSVLALSHDLTQWGYGGRVLAAEESAGTVTITLDQPVPAPTSGNAYVGLRIPGEGAYRVFQVAPFSGESDTLTLVGAWPGDAPLPGDDVDNPAHDTLWIYDFKATPGYRVRVVQIEPEGDLRGARVAVVPESPEFWTYVETGEYTPPAGGSQLLTRPVASNLRIAELQTVQGDTVFTELQATFDVSGPMAYATVHLAQQIDGEWSEVRQVAETRTQQARFRIPGAGVYMISVRPYNEDGMVGTSATVQYTTQGADVPPPAYDFASVTDLGAGVRKYSWGYSASTVQAPDYAGAEVRYIAGTHADPDWDAMQPVVGDGFHPAPFEAVTPAAAGTYTFAFRARNTSGMLSEPKIIVATLSANLPTVIDQTIDELVEQQERLDQEIADRIAGDLAEASARGLAVANLQAQLNVVAAQVADVLEADEWDNATTYPYGDLVQYNGKLYRSLQDDNVGNEPDQSPTWWEYVGDYSSLGEAVAASIRIGNQNTSDIAAESSRIDVIAARMPAGTGQLATAASVSSEASARASADSALSSRLDVVEARMPAGTGELATAAALNALDGRVTSAEGQISSQGSALTAVQAEIATARDGKPNLDARLDGMDSQIATKASASAVSALDARVTSAEGQISSQASAITAINTTLGNQSASITQLMEVTGSARLVDVRNSSFETDDGWAANTNGTGGLPSGVTFETATAHSGSRVLRFSGVSTTVYNAGRTPVRPGERLRVGGWVRKIGSEPNSGSRLRIGLRSYDASGAFISGSALTPVDVSMPSRSFLFRADPDTGIYTVPAGAATVQLYVQTTGLTSGAVACDDVFIERISETENRLMARHTLALDVNGNISGMVNENDGETSSFSILANVFRVISGPTAGIEWQNGYLRAYALGAQIVLGSNFGSENNLMLWCGPNIGADNCSKANGTFWVDNTGDAYFAGRVLQGVLRWFNSTTSTASNASVSTGSNPRLGKNVALAARYQYSENWTYLGGTVTPGPGNTAATIVIERRYGSGSWTTLATRTIPGIAEAYNNPGSGDPSSWNVSISGEVFATDTASTSNSEYRARITSRSVQSHNPGTGGQPVVRSQYLSIEAME